MNITAFTESRAPSRYHHSSHRRLLSSPDDLPRKSSTVDAIIVPTARHGSSLQTAIDLAAQLDCTLVALCSKWALSRHVVGRARLAGIKLVAIDVGEIPKSVIPRFNTTDMLAGTLFERRTDTSLKRNLGLLIARMSGWQRIVFLDDDITVPRADDLRDAVALLDRYDGVGLSIGGFPDNSVVCHAYRDAGGLQDTFIGGGALAVGSASMTSFFPNIYNEDWFFLLNDVRLRPSTMIGTAIQRPYDPYRDDLRARSEELGDTLAEGVYWLLDHGRRVQDADIEFWQDFLRKRRLFINEVADMVGQLDIDLETKYRMIIALKSAWGRSHVISPKLCVDYLRAWRADRTRWRQHVNERCAGPSLHPEKVLAELGLLEHSRYVTNGREVRRGRRTVADSGLRVSSRGRGKLRRVV